jgi:uncharacterized protein
MNRRTFIATLGGTFLCGRLEKGLASQLFNPCLGALPAHLAADPTFQEAWNGIDPTRVWDCHAHLVGVGDGSSGAYANPHTTNPLFVSQFVQRIFYMNAACARNAKGEIDRSYVEHLHGLLNGLPHGIKIMLFAFETFHDTNGAIDWRRTTFHTPNKYARDMAQDFPSRFEWVASIHPYRSDCVAELRRAKQDGARAVKWLPSAMGIDPASKKCDEFYAAMADLNLPLITHAGHEAAVDVGSGQSYGNPLLLRRALDHGVRVVIAHCASLGKDHDIDKGPGGPWIDSLQLFDRLMHEPAYERLLFGDISAITQRNRAEKALAYLLPRKYLHERLLNGSDYPLPGVMPLFSLEHLAQKKLLDEKAIPVLKQVRKYNALLFDFLLKRRVNIRGDYFDATVFHTRPFFQTISG